MLAAPELARLDAITPPFDPFEVLAWTHMERPHTRFLAWLVDPIEPRPGGGHGLGTAVLQALVARALRLVERLPGDEAWVLPSELAPIDPTSLQVWREVPIGDGVRERARAPDLRCTWRDPDGTPWLLLIENKIDAGEGEGQVRDYLDWAARTHPDAHRLLLYVTPDGRLPDSPPRGEVVVPLTWSELAETVLEAIAATPSKTHGAARAFAVATLEALRVRFGGRADVRSLVEALHDAHPRAAALAASPATEPALLETLTRRYPTAAWHLRTVRPRARRWTRAWAEAVAEALGKVLSGVPHVTACAPHVDRPDMASWSLEGITETLSLHLLCTNGAPFGTLRPRAWVGLHAPNLHPHELFEQREQRAAIDALPEQTRRWLLEAVPVFEAPDAWRWLCVGTPTPLTRGFSLEDDALRAARCLHALVAPHLAALQRLARDPTRRLYSCDLDLDHLLPTDRRDRETLFREASPAALRVTLVTRRPSGHPYELRRECELALALGAAFGGKGNLVYDFAPAASLGILPESDVVLAGVGLFRPPDEHTVREAAATVRAAVERGAILFLCGDRGDIARVQSYLGALLEPMRGPAAVVEAEAGGVRLLATDPALEPLVGHDGRWIFGALGVTLDAEARVGLWLCEPHGATWPLVAGWRVGGSRVLWWAGGALGPWGRGLRAQPAAFARWWEAIVRFARSL